MSETYTHLKRYTRPRDFADFADFDRTAYYVAYGQHRDSDALTRSNFAVMLQRLGGESETVLIVRDNHWAVGWIETIYILATDTERSQHADTMLADLDDYPVLDEEHFSATEHEDADLTWRNCYSPTERIAYIREHRSQFEFHNYADLRGCVRGEYFAGYASELLG